MDENFKTPLILGRPFLATARALIDVEQRKLILRVQNEKVILEMESKPPSVGDPLGNWNELKAEPKVTTFQDSGRVETSKQSSALSNSSILKLIGQLESLIHSSTIQD